MKILAQATAFTLAASSAIAGGVALIEPETVVVAEETGGTMGGSGLWLIPLLAIALIFLATQGNDDQNFSDKRLKADIIPVGMSLNGLPLYQFRYIGRRQKYVGVMAQDVLAHTPEAVVRSFTGFYRVNYKMLGLEMQKVA